MARVEKNKELSNYVDSYKFLMDGARTEIEIKAVDRYKTSSVFDAFMHREFRNGMKEYLSFLQLVVSQKVLEDLSRAIANNMKISQDELRKARKFPSKEGKPKVYVNDKARSHFLGGRMDEELVLSEKKESEDKEDDGQAPISKFIKGDLPPKGKDVGESSGQVAPSQNPDPLAF
ncbi:hypothetical protein ACOSP7_021164 [Xanthoceras sorbifolium]